MWQKCPICNGTGTLMNSFGQVLKCEVCNGTKIISEITGKPPVAKPTEEEKRQSTLGGIEKAMEDINNFQGRLRCTPKEKVFTAKDMISFAITLGIIRMDGETISPQAELEKWVKRQIK